MNMKPSETQERGGYFVTVDTRNGKVVSFPTTKRQASADTLTMNRAFTEAWAEMVAEGVEAADAIAAGQY